MITPEYLAEVAQAVENQMSSVDAYLIGRVASHVVGTYYKQGKKLMIPSSINDLRRVMNRHLGELQTDVISAVALLIPTINDEVKLAFLDAADEIREMCADATKQAIASAGIAIDMPSGLTDAEMRLIESAYRRTGGTFENITRSLPDVAKYGYTAACDNAWLKIRRGISPQAAIHDAVIECAQSGLRTATYYNTPTGVASRHDRIEVAAARAVRTGVNQANGDAVLMRCAEIGVGYVKVSEHFGARVTPRDDYTNHSWWQGKVYKLDFANPALSEFKAIADKHPQAWQGAAQRALEARGDVDYPDFVKTCGFGDIQGILGVNCRHTFAPFFPWIQKDPTPRIDEEKNKKRYEDTQRQRAMERRMRDQRRRIEALKQMPDAESEAKEAKQRLEDMGADYDAFCRANKLPRANWRLEIAL